MTVLDDEPSDFITDRNDDSLHGSTIPVQSYAMEPLTTESSITSPNVTFASVKPPQADHIWQPTSVSKLISFFF